MTVQIIRSPSGDEMVILPRADYDRLRKIAEAADDAKAAAEVLARVQSGVAETVPGDIVNRLLAGESPIKVWREHRGMTQGQLAAAIGTSKMYLSQIERGERRGSIKMLRGLAGALRVDLDDLAAA